METKKYQLPKEFAAKWVEALRSGKYKQGTGCLQSDGDRYCCLGVAVHLAGVEDSELDGHGTLDDSWDDIPYQLMGSANESMDDYNLLVNILVSHNDGNQHDQINPKGESWGFNKIADWIETNVEFI